MPGIITFADFEMINGYNATIKRSINRGGENSAMLAGEDDFYELFMASIGGSRFIKKVSSYSISNTDPFP